MSNPFDQFDAATPQGDSNPFDQFDAGKKKDSRSAVGEIANQFKAGILVDLPKMAGQALKYTSDPGNKVYEAGQGITDWADEQGKRPDLAPQEDQHNIVTNALASGARMIPQSVAPAAAVGAGILALPASIPATVGLGAASVLGAVPAAMSQGQETLEKAREKGIPEDQALAAARSNALIEGGGEALGTYAGGKLLGIAGKTAGKMFGRTAGDALADQTSTAITKPFLKQLGETALVETGTEIGQNAGEAAVENAYGIDSKTPYQAGKEAIAPTLGMTALLAPFGLAGFAHAGKQRGERTNALASAETTPEDRQKIAGEFAAEISKVDKNAAANFMANAQSAIDGKQALSIGESMFLPPVAAEETPAPLSLPAPTYTGTPSDQVMAAEVERQNQADAAQKSADALYAERSAFEQANAGIAATPAIPVVGPLSAAANIAVQSGAHASAVAQQAAAQAAQNTTPEGKAGTPAEAQPNATAPASGTLAGIAAMAPTTGGQTNAAIPAQVAKEAPQADAPKAGATAAQATSQGQGIDLSNRTHAQLNYLTQHGKPGFKEAAVAELAKRGIEISAPKASADSESVPALKAGNSGNQAPKLGDFIEGPNGYRIRIDEHKKGSNQLDPVADAGALVYEVRKGSGDANPLTMVLNKDGKLVDKKSVMNADGSSNGTAFVPPGAVSRGQLVELLQARAKTETGSAERSSIDQKIKDLVTRYTNKPEAAPVKSEQPQQVKGAENGQAETEVLKQPGAVSNAAPVEDPIGWTRMTTVEREALVARAGWAGKIRGMNLGGVRVATQAWDAITEANRAKLIAGNQNTIKNEKPAAATVSKTESVSEQAPIKKDVAVDAGSDPDLNIEKRILFAADSIDKLRKVDVERVLAQGNIDRQKMAEYIKRKRPDLSGEVDDVMAELQPSVSQPKTDAAHEAKQDKAPASKPKPARNKIDPEKDSMFAAIAKAGGMDTDELLSNGIDSNDITYETSAKVKKDGQLGKKRRMPISFGFALPLHKKGGMSFDAMREAMQQYGYLPEGATKNDAIDLFKQELAGDPVYTAQAIEVRQERDQEEFDKMMQEEQDRIDAELAAQEIVEDETGFNDLSFDEQSLANDFAEFAFGENGKQDDNATRAGMRALGFTEEEINDELAKNSQAQRESEEITAGPGQESGAGRNGNRAEDAQARQRDDEQSNFGLDQQTNEQAAEQFAQQQDGEPTTPNKAQADRERDAVPFSLGQQSQPKPQGMQTGLFTADGRPSVAAKQEQAQGDLIGASKKELDSVSAAIEEKRLQLVAIEDKIVGAAGLAPGFIEDALRSRKVPAELKGRRQDLRAELADLREQYASLNTPSSTQSAVTDDFGHPEQFKAGELARKRGDARALPFALSIAKGASREMQDAWFAGFDKAAASKESTAEILKPAEGAGQLDAAKIRAGYAHRSLGGLGDKVKMEQGWFDNAAKEFADKIEEKAESDDQKALAAKLLTEFKDEYKTRRYRVMETGAGVVSSAVAGRNNFNSTQAGKRGSALDRAEQEFSDWLKAAIESGVRAIRAARSPEQIAAEQKAKDDKAAKKKADLHALLGKLMDFKKGDDVRFGNYPVAKVSLDKAGYPSSVTVDATDLTDNKFDIARILFAGDKDKLREAVDEIRASRPAPSAEEGAPASREDESSDNTPRQYSAMADIDSAIESIFDGTVSLADYKAAFNGLMANKDAIAAELGKMTIPQLHERFGKHPYGRPEKKGEIVERSFEIIRNAFALRRSFGPNSYTMSAGGLAKFEADKLAALTEMVNASTAEDLKAFAEEIGKTRAARQEKIEAAQDPKTIEDFDNALRLKKAEGMTFAEARMSLTPEQRAEYDRLKGVESRDQRKARADQQKTDVRVASQTTGAQIVEGTHSKQGYPLWSVQLADRVDGDSYKTLLSTAKRMGGNYVNQMQSRMWKTVWGFQFKDQASAEAFMKLAAGDKTDAEAAIQERRDAFADDRSQSAVERLNEMAERLEEKADESLGRERKANTERRARFAASAEAAANAEKAMATTMRRIADAIGNGTAQFLDRVRQKAQIEYLTSVLKTAKGNELRTKYPSYAEQQRHEGEPATGETADYAEFPLYAMMRSDLANLARKMVTLPNMKMLGQRILKVADDTSAAYTAFAKENLLEVSRFGKADGSGWATFSTLKDAERSIDVSNLSAVAVPLQIKRGEYRIVLSPSEAINRGIWKGDDRKIYLSADIGEEIVEKLGKLNRKYGKRRGMDVPPEAPWQFENAYNNRKRLAGMGIEQPWEFRAALREFASLKEAPKEADKIKAMERAMIGRKNDGLDFFPTPAGTAQEMVDAAEIAEGMAVLEPSAGMGHIAEQIREVAGVDPDVIEFNGDRRELLEAKGFNVVGSDFLEADGRYDRIIMNPPFSNRRDAEHVQHAYSLLKPGGRIVAIMGEGVFFGQDKKAVIFREWLDEVGGTSEKLEEGTFLDPSLPVNTATNARMVVIDKPAGESAPADNEGAGTIASPGSMSPADKAIYGMATEGKSAAEILKFIASASRNPFYRQLAKLLQKTGINPSVTVGDGKGWKFNAGEGNKYAAGYNPKSNTVALFRPASAERNMLHELVHAASLKALSGKGMAAAQMNALYQHVKKTGKLKGMYGMSDVDEFIAEAFSNPQFQARLKTIAAPQASAGTLSSAWNWFVRIVRGILGVSANEENALSQALEIGVDVMRENMRLNGDPKNANVRGMADKDTVAGTQAPTSAGDGSIERVVDVSGNGNRVQYFNDKKGTFVESQKYPTGKVKWMAGEVIDGQPQWFSAELFDTKEDAERSIRGSKAKERYNQKYGSIPNVWQGEAKKAAKAIIDAGFSVDRFSSSTQSRSKYIYLENGLKIRLADHALPISYDSPDIDFRYGDDIKSLVNEISKATEGAPTPDSAATRLPGAPDQAGMQERPKAEHAQSTGGAGSASNVTGINYERNSNDPNASAGSDAGIRYNVADDHWGVAEPSKMDDVIYALQDKHIDTKRVMQAIMGAGKKIKDSFNPYLQEELFHGRSAKGVKDFLDLELRPLLKQMQEAKVDMGDFEEYLWNRHAEERNKQIAKINPDMPDGGSGIETAKARAYLAGLSAEQRKTFEALAAKVETMNRESQRVLVESGLEKQSTIDAWNNAYQHYVPLQREDVDSGHVGTGKGFSVRGSSSKRAMGSGKNVVDIIANLTMQRERNIVRAEKNRVSNALMGLAVENPNKDFWTVDVAPKERVVEETAIYTVVDEGGAKLGEFTRMSEAEKLANKTPGSTIDQKWGDRVTERVVPGFKNRDNVLLTRVNGDDHYIIFNERDERAMRMATAMKNMDVDNLGRVLSLVGRATRYLSAINTQYNPVFGVINLIRDAQGALLNLSSTPLAGEQKRVMAYTKDALVGIYKDIRAHRAGLKPSSNWASLFEEFQREGGATGYRDQYANAEARAEAIKAELEQFKEGKAKQLTRGLFGWLSDYNETMENAVRLASYKAAIEKGMSKAQAASLAKNITVNFNRKGQMATQVGSLYAFFNASVQGTARIAGTLFDMKDGDIKTARLSKTGKKIVYGGIMLGSMQALLLAAAGFGDDEPPDFIKERNLILPIGDGKYLTLAMPLGYHVFPGIGRLATEFVLSGGKDPLKKIAAFGSMFAEALNPIGNSGFSLQTITPSVIDPLAALAENRDFTGKEIYQNDFNKLNPTPGFTRAKDTATAWSKAIAEGLNFITGGTDYKPGLFTPTPDQIDYLIGQVTGGVGREVGKVSQVVSATTTGEDLPIYKVPLVGRFVGDTQGKSGESAKFYNSLREINMHEAEYKGLIGDGKRQEAAEYLAENPAVKLIMLGNQSERAVKKLKEAKRNLIENDAPQEKVAAMEDQIAKSMKLFNDRVTKALAQ